MELIDTHSHLTFDELRKDVDQVLSRSRVAGVTTWITVGTDSENNRSVVELAAEYDNLYAAVGIHPHHAKDVGTEDIALLKELARNEKVVAIGEAGLDFHYNFSGQDAQRRIFCAQLDLADELDLPIIVHCRDAFDETLAILNDFAGSLGRVVFHCYSGTVEQTRMLLDRGWYISFTGIVTFRNAEQTRQAVEIVPLDRMMIETDCPYISPEPVRNIRPCEPALLIHTAQKIAELKGISLPDLAGAVTATSRKFFNLP